MAVFCERTAADPGLLARPDVQKLTPYQSARRIMQAAGVTGEVWLNANESAEAEPMAPETKLFNRYPEPQPEAVVERYAAYAGVSPEQILVTRGGDEGIELLVRTFCRPGEDAVLQFPPTYGMYAVSAETNGAEVVNLVTSPDRGWLPDVAEAAKVLEERTDVKLVFACSPGNPTGTLIPVGMLRKLAELTAGRALLVIDEAYIEFTPANTAVELLKDYPHVVIIRTLSKAFALAGLRCGFLLSSPAVIGMLRKVIAPYPIPVPCADIAAQALSPESVSLMHRRAAQCVMRKCELEVALEDLDGVEAVYPSASNFLLVRFVDAARVERNTKETRIVVEAWLDRSGKNEINTGVGFFDHMLTQIAVHGGIRLHVRAVGDLEIDDHHTIEDVGLALGEALKEALGDKRGIRRFGFLLPMDETLARCALDISGRPYLTFKAKFKHHKVGDMATEMVEHFFRSLAQTMGVTLNLKAQGRNDHHVAEGLFKAFGRTLRDAVKIEGSDLPSSKGVL